jgi:DNA repair protein RecO (recombination protein O)
MIETATGLVLRTRPLTETSLIVHWLTPTAGRIATVAKGARRPKSPFRGQIDLFYLADLAFERSKRSELHTLREVRLRATHGGLREDLQRLEQTAYCAQLLEQATEMEAPVPGLYDLMLGLLSYLVSHPAQPRVIFAFELRFLNELGLQPDFAQSSLNHETRQLVKALLETDWPGLVQLRASAAQVTALGQFLHGFLIYHLGKLPKGRAVALLRSPRAIAAA